MIRAEADNMEKTVTKTADTVEEAIKAALEELGVSEADAKIEVISEPKSGLLGVGKKEAEVMMILKLKGLRVQWNTSIFLLKPFQVRVGFIQKEQESVSVLQGLVKSESFQLSMRKTLKTSGIR